MGQAGDSGLMCQHRTCTHFPGHKIPESLGHPSKLPGPFEHFNGVYFHLYQVFDGFYGVTKDEASPLKSPEDITDHGESAALYLGKEQGRALSPINAPLYSPNLEGGVNLLGNANKFSTRLKFC